MLADTLYSSRQYLLFTIWPPFPSFEIRNISYGDSVVHYNPTVYSGRVRRDPSIHRLHFTLSSICVIPFPYFRFTIHFSLDIFHTPFHQPLTSNAVNYFSSVLHNS